MPLSSLYNRLTTLVLSHRILFYFVFSLASVSAVIANALRSYSNFYSVAISLSKSSRSVLALANFAFLIALVCGHLIQRIFFGALRANEVERLYDRLWFFVTESLLAFTIFRDEFDIPFAMMFGFLLFIKSFHWLAGDRIEWMDQRPYPGPPLSFHVRMISLFSLLWCIDLIMFLYSVENTLTQGVGGMVLFASEYGILMASMLNSISKYLLSAYELRRAGRRGGENAPPWENKSMWTFYIELVTDFLKLTTYLAFFAIIITFYGVPLNIIRDVYITARSFVSKLRALHRYQNATRNMDQRYPNATPEELAAMSDHTCIICREEMILPEPAAPGQAPANTDGPNTTPKKLPCGHIFHFYCLRSWLERQQSCPTCRRTVLDAPAAPANNAAPPAPGPGVPPPQGQAAGQLAPNQNLPVNNPLGNPLGLVGRLFGVPPQPNQPAQPVNNGNVRAATPATRPAGDQPFHEVVIRYHIPAGQQPQPQPQERPLREAPVYQGFVGPNGEWQQWPTAQNQARQTETSAPEGAGASSGTSQSEPESTPTSAVTDPREAAARAALQRLSPGNASSASNGQASGAGPSTRTHSDRANRDNDASTSMHASRAPIDVPTLIPLHTFTPGANHRSINRTAPPATSESLPPPSAQNPQPSTSGAKPSTLHNGQPSLASPGIREDQIAALDRITREAIDERLRRLEGISNTLYRCVDELVQLRSTLPTEGALPNSGGTSQSHKTPTAIVAPNAGPSQPPNQDSQQEGEATWSSD